MVTLQCTFADLVSLQIGALFLIMGSFVMDFIDSLCSVNKALQYVFNFLPSYALGKGLVNVRRGERLSIRLTHRARLSYRSRS